MGDSRRARAECEHENFSSNVAISRLENVGRFAADIHITCTDCDTPFKFLGLPGGLYPDKPTVDVAQIEARMPIAPLEEEWILRLEEH